MPELTVRVGSRASRLALWQTEHVIARLEAAWPGLPCERVPIRTLGDRVTDVPLPRIGDRGLFTKEIEDGLRRRYDRCRRAQPEGSADRVPPGLALGAVLVREDPRDALVAATGATLATCRAGARVGTSSVRRRAQLLARRPDLQMVDIRGNVPTRLEKVTRGDVRRQRCWRWPACGGSASTRRSPRCSRPTSCCRRPARARWRCRCGPTTRACCDLVARLDHAPTRLATACERGVLDALEGGCQAPVGTWTRVGRPHAAPRRDRGELRRPHDRTRPPRSAAVEHDADALALASRVADDAARADGARDIIAACRVAVADLPRPGSARA